MSEPRYLTLADNLELMRPNAHGRIVLALEKSQRDEVVKALRLAAKPADDVREALVLAQAAISAAIELHKPDPAGLLLTALNKVDRALSPTGAPKL